MSLTVEEKEFIENLKKNFHFVKHTEALTKLCSIIDRLSARCEYLEEAFDAAGKEVADAKNNLSSLLSAVEPITKRLTETPQGEHLWPPVYLMIYTDDLRTLSTVAAGIRGGKK